ncbi:alpha-amylase family glycosyl hydrolase [Gelidibacter salicanalis]|uniref:T9SS type A sorting domain-containing protein n=1 Tax=Gelidibacter salicanalis TaxID=291193 RepID=A0A934KX19_9FLAO|nr:alpha-amylase family glycosyl hydrolase [Gelidibacter salicanalis]MBJ7882147.1 T9SS type A sorting domain-containing protein [Gelidibacter salicanalis]
MKKITFYIMLFMCSFAFAQQQNVTYTVAPSTFEENQNITITFNGNSINEATWGVTTNSLYLWAWSYDVNLTNQQDCPTNGAWTASSETNKLSYNSSNDTYSISFTPTTFFQRNGIGRIGFLIKAKNGDGNKKSQDILLNVGSFQVTLTSPQQNSTTILTTGGSLNISATNSGGNASYNLIANGASINTNVDTSNYLFTHSNITSNQNYKLEVTLAGTTITKLFSVVIKPTTISATLPSGMIDGINYNTSDNTKATLVLDAPNKDFVDVAGTFNNWEPNSNYAMKRDPTTGKFWLELTGLVSGQTYTYQYWVFEKTPITNSPALVKTADPYSTLVLSPFDDPYIPASSYPNLPAYPAGQEREVTVLQTGQTPYNWQVNNFTKPKKEDLIIYEVLIRDFDSDRNYQDLIDRIEYFKNLNINAIELLPVMEFEGNESWGYNTSFHMALDKFYGAENKLKEFIDLCHQNGIAVILDVALNHAYGRNPMVRMWMDDPDGDGWGGPSSENPYFNTEARHSYNVGSDFNHSNAITKAYAKRIVKHWIEEFKIDGFRWDLTKGFTQNCTANDEGCTNAYQADRVAVLKEYADYSWSLDPNHYVIFEHLGSENEEKEWANYKYDEGKGIMMWGNMNRAYNELTMGYTADISGIGHKSRPQFQGLRVIGYAESHDEERLMYKNLMYGNSTNSVHDVKDLNTALSRMSALGAVTLTVPGPKMIWHFGELGMQNSIFTCNDGTLNIPDAPLEEGGDAGNPPGDCKLATKPQPQWTQNWLGDTNRNKVYNDWARLIKLKTEEDVFEGDYKINTNTLTPSIEIFNNALPGSSLKNVIVLANFDVTSKTLNTTIPSGETWYDLMDDTGKTSYNQATISIAAGQFRIFGNKPSTLSTDGFESTSSFTLYPNPSNSRFKVNRDFNGLDIYDLTGKHIKSFKGNFTQKDSFDVSDLDQSLYVIKINDYNGHVSTSKLIKM